MLRALALILALFARLASAAVALDVGFPVRDTDGTVVVTTPGTDRLLVAVVTMAGSGLNASHSVSGGGLTWTSQGLSVDADGFNAVQIWTAPAASAITSQTLTFTMGGSGVHDFRVYSFSGADLADIGATGGVAATTGTSSTFSMTIEAVGSYVLGGAVYWNGDTTFVGTSGFTVDNEQLSAASDDHCNFHKTTLTSATGALTAGVTHASGYHAARGVEVKEGSGGGDPPAAAPTRTLMGVGT